MPDQSVYDDFDSVLLNPVQPITDPTPFERMLDRQETSGGFMIFAPDKTHLGDKFLLTTPTTTYETLVLAYGDYNDDLDAALLLLQPVPPYRYDDSWKRDFNETVEPANYAAVLVDKDGNATNVWWFWNLHDASNFAQENMGQDR